jgi:hypothetical protein
MHPIVVFIIILSGIIRCNVAIQISEENAYLLPLIGDPYHVYNAKLEGNKIIISIGFFALLSMLFDYYE